MVSNSVVPLVKETPEFASICSFIDLFGEDLNISLTHNQLIRFLELKENENIPKIWIDIHRKLLNRIKYQCTVEKWESKLKKFFSSFLSICYDNVFTINFIRYDLLKPIERARILNILFDSQFDRNAKFKEKVNLKPNKSLRNLPFGSDVYGRLYWLFVDSDINVIAYKENLEEESFTIIAETVDDLKKLELQLRETDVDNVELSTLYKFPEETDSPIGEINDPEKQIKKELELALNSKVEVASSPTTTNSTNVINGNVEEESVNKAKTESIASDKKMEIVSEKQELDTSAMSEMCQNENQMNFITMSKDAKEEEKLNSISEKNEEEMSLIIDTEGKISKEDNLNNSFSVEDIIGSSSGALESEKKVDDIGDASETNLTLESNKKKLGRRSKRELIAILNQEQPKKDIEENFENSHTELRRSLRQRKPVSLFTIEHNTREEMTVSSHDEIDNKTKKKSSKKTKKNKGSKDEGKKFTKSMKKKKNTKHGESIKKGKKGKVKHKDLNGKHRKKNHKKNRKKPWEGGGESSEEEVVEMEEYDIYEEESDCKSDILNKENGDMWDDKPESDFDPEKLSETSDEETLRQRGRNYFRQQKRQKKKAEEVVEEDSTLCQICLGSQLPEMMLLCDRCDLGHHVMCLRPALMLVPEGDWFCPKCCHRQLVQDLTVKIPELEKAVIANQARVRMQERLNFVNISMTNIISSTRKKSEPSSHNKLHRNNSNDEDNDDEGDDDEGDEEDDDDDDDSSSRSGSTSSGEENNSSASERKQKRPYRFRETVKKEYKFDELDKIFDEALVYDEKYRLKKKKRNVNNYDDNYDGNDDNANGNGDNNGDNDTKKLKSCADDIEGEKETIDSNDQTKKEVVMNEEVVDDDNDEEQEESDADYDYSEIIPRKKSSGKDLSNMLQDDSEEDENGKESKMSIEKPKLSRASHKRSLSYSSSNEDLEDDKDADFRLSEEEISDEDVVDNDLDELDKESDDWKPFYGRPTRRSNRGKILKSKPSRKSTKRRKKNSKTKSNDRAIFAKRPRRNASRHVNYREMIGEDDSEEEETEEEEEEEEEKREKDEDEKVEKKETKEKEKEEEEEDVYDPEKDEESNKSPDFESSDDCNEAESDAEECDFGVDVVKEENKRPPLLTRGTGGSSRKRRKIVDSDTEYEASPSLSDDALIERKSSESGSTDKLEDRKCPQIKETDINTVDEPPLAKMIKLEENENTSSIQKLILEESTHRITVKDILEQQPPLLSAEDTPVTIKNPMRADQYQPDDVEDEVESESEYDYS